MIDTHTYKNQLETMLEQIVTQLETLAVYDTETGDWVAKPDTSGNNEADTNAEADVVEDWNERRGTLAQLETRYNNIKKSLDKIEQGTYGICEISGEEIETDRLDANPAARTCTKHMNEEDQLPR